MSHKVIIVITCQNVLCNPSHAGNKLGNRNVKANQHTYELKIQHQKNNQDRTDEIHFCFSSLNRITIAMYYLKIHVDKQNHAIFSIRQE